MSEQRRRIVVGVDGSDQSIKAVRWADQQAKATGSDITLLAAWHWPVAVGAPMGGLALAGLDPRSDAQAFAEKAQAEITVPASRVTVTVIEGAAGSTLVKEAADADLLVVGSRGHGSVGGMLLGSVSAYCVHHATVPVVIVR